MISQVLPSESCYLQDLLTLHMFVEQSVSHAITFRRSFQSGEKWQCSPKVVLIISDSGLMLSRYAYASQLNMRAVGPESARPI